jgi:hypothetical protein
MSLTTDVPVPSATVARPLRPAVAARRPLTVTRVPRRRWAILSRVGPSVRTVILPVRSRAAALSSVRVCAAAIAAPSHGQEATAATVTSAWRHA